MMTLSLTNIATGMVAILGPLVPLIALVIIVCSVFLSVFVALVLLAFGRS